MKVSNELQGLQSILPGREVEMAGRGGKSTQAGQTAGADQATLSPAASLAAMSGPDSDLRMEKVARVQQALANGTYNVASSDVADKMIDGMLGK